VGEKSDTLLPFEFPPLLDALYLQFLVYSLTIFVRCRRSSSADVNKFCVYTNKLLFRHDGWIN